MMLLLFMPYLLDIPVGVMSPITSGADSVRFCIILTA